MSSSEPCANTALQLTRQITDAIKRFGVSSTTKRLVVVKITYAARAGERIATERANEEQQFVDQMARLIEGQMVSLDVLEDDDAVDWQRIKKVSRTSLHWLRGEALISCGLRDLADLQVERCSDKRRDGSARIVSLDNRILYRSQTGADVETYHHCSRPIRDDMHASRSCV